MRLVVADTGPINYLILIDCIDLLPALFESVTLPSSVEAELLDAGAPSSVRNWAIDPPSWLQVRPNLPVDSGKFHLESLHEGEAAAIALAIALGADLLLMDDRKGVHAASSLGLRVTGTLGILDLAAQRQLADFSQAIARLRKTNFRVPEQVLESLVRKHVEGRRLL